MRETVACESDLCQCGIFIQSLKKDGLYTLREKVVLKLHYAYLFIELKGIDQIDETCIIETAAGEVEFLQFALKTTCSLCKNVSEVAKYLIS